MTDLATTYLGLALRSPIVASAGPFTGDPEMAERLAAAGAAAIVMPSLFEEELLREELDVHHALDVGAEAHAEATDYFPDVGEHTTIADRYVARMQDLRSRVDVPVIASLNAGSLGGWEAYARVLEDAGASAIELNVYRVPADPERSAADVEDGDLRMIAAVRATVGVPLAVKLSPYYSSLANFARRAVDAGADGLVLFNRFYQPDIDLENLDVVPRVELSHSWELRAPLRWTAILRPLLPQTSIAVTSGVASGTDVVKAIVAGADIAMTTSELLRHGPERLTAIEREMAEWFDARGYTSVAEARGSMSYSATDDPAAYERANYVRTLHSWSSPHDASNPGGPSLSF